MKILLSIPLRDGMYTKFPDELLSIAAVLEKNGHHVMLHDANLGDRTAESFRDFGPDIVGFSVSTGCVADSIKKAIDFKKTFPGIKTVWGFRHPSALPEQTLAEEYVDYVIIGAGEYTLLELAEYLEKGTGSLAEIKGLAWKNGNDIVINEPRAFLNDLDELPDPAWHMVHPKKYWDVSIITSRGCPFSCTFCSDATFYKGNVSDLSAERIASQSERLRREFGINYIMYTGDNFGINKERLHEFCRIMIKKKLKLKWNCQISGYVTEEDARLMAKAGCTAVILGTESGSQKILDLLTKGNVQEFEKTFWNLVRQRIIPTLFIQYAFPTETAEDFKETLEFIKRLDNPPYLFMKFVPYPKTVLFDRCAKDKLISVPEKLADWSGFQLHYATQGNLSAIPQRLMDDTLSRFRATFASRRLFFMLRHNPVYFINAVREPKQFFSSLLYLIKNFLNALFDGSNGKESWLVKLRRILEMTPSLELQKNNVNINLSN
ncbi:B12-binding domain-containing radical SAM protein [Dehalogenimonas etheniformans]|uniref:Radical SAM protein n=1 Tax=Dehalogenimonas etheniformans TaxID=1536648 RepID=A0A2P5P5L0_9CHLR|nr:radical SAM protein [Dehalogenimonas etheniformans]PPD57583.1 radical SAM protein [Dehalogenimonas etheniformans]QNT75921.1 B12-binding domain-containing radical SAM protein [Dehalogenimonas etheniformans]